MLNLIHTAFTTAEKILLTFLHMVIGNIKNTFCCGKIHISIVNELMHQYTNICIFCQ